MLALLHLGPARRAPLEILGYPVANLVLSVDRPNALVVVRVCDICEPDGSSLLVTRGLLNLTHRNSHEHPEPLVPGERFTARVVLQAIGQVVPAGHRLRVCVSRPPTSPGRGRRQNPSPLTVYSAASSIELPLRGLEPARRWTWGLRSARDRPEARARGPREDRRRAHRHEEHADGQGADREP